MKTYKRILTLIFVLALVLLTFTGCNKKDTSLTDLLSNPSENPAATDNITTIDFKNSDYMSDTGFWKDIRALDFVKIGDYSNISIPSDIHEITDDEVQSQINTILADYVSYEQVTDRAIIDGDTVNIDYVGSVDGVEFEGGSTAGEGTEVTIGVTPYIDDFLEQLIGHSPGESFDIEVTFPADYENESLNGKDAVFAITINYIVNTVSPELTDDFVRQNLSAEYGWNTVTEMNESIKSDLKSSAITVYLENYIVNNATITSLPDTLLKFQENSMVYFYQQYADSYSISIDEFLDSYIGVANVDELLQTNLAENTAAANLYLVKQAIAEDAGITVTDDDVSAYFSEYVGSADYAEYEAEYGMPYLKMIVLNQKVTDYLTDNSIQE